MYKTKSITLYFEENDKQSIQILYGGDPNKIFLDINSDPEDPYQGANIEFTLDEFCEFINYCKEALTAKKADNG